jgi:hypothetical protein
MSTLIITALAAAATAFVWYQTIQGYRTGVLNVRSRIDRRVSPRIYALNLVLMAILSLVMLGAVALMIYGETHPEWRRERAKHVERMRQQFAFKTIDHGSNTMWQ